MLLLLNTMCPSSTLTFTFSLVALAPPCNGWYCLMCTLYISQNLPGIFSQNQFDNNDDNNVYTCRHQLFKIKDAVCWNYEHYDRADLPAAVSRASVADFMAWKPVLRMLWTTISNSGAICTISITTSPMLKNLPEQKSRLKLKFVDTRLLLFVFIFMCAERFLKLLKVWFSSEVQKAESKKDKDINDDIWWCGIWSAKE